MIASSATIFAQRPVSSTERARAFASNLSATRFPPARESPPPSLASSLASSFDGVRDTDLHGDLVDLREHLRGFEGRLKEPLVGQILDATRATSGDLYVLRSQLRRGCKPRA